MWTETPTKLLYTDFVHILDCQVEYFISMCELWDLEHFLHTEFFLHYFSLFLSRGRKFTSLPHLQLYCGYLWYRSRLQIYKILIFLGEIRIQYKGGLHYCSNTMGGAVKSVCQASLPQPIAAVYLGRKILIIYTKRCINLVV